MTTATTSTTAAKFEGFFIYWIYCASFLHVKEAHWPKEGVGCNVKINTFWFSQCKSPVKPRPLTYRPSPSTGAVMDDHLVTAGVRLLTYTHTEPWEPSVLFLPASLRFLFSLICLALRPKPFHVGLRMQKSQEGTFINMESTSLLVDWKTFPIFHRPWRFSLSA